MNEREGRILMKMKFSRLSVSGRNKRKAEDEGKAVFQFLEKRRKNINEGEEVRLSVCGRVKRQLLVFSVMVRWNEAKKLL